MGNRSTVPTNRSHLALVDARRPRPGQLMALRVQRIREADRTLQESWVRATHGLPGRANRAIEDFRRARRSPWRGQLEGITQALERAAQVGPAEVERCAAILLTAYGLYEALITDTRDELLAACGPDGGPSAPALRRAA